MLVFRVGDSKAMPLSDLKKLHENRVGLTTIKESVAKSKGFDEIKMAVTTLTVEVESHLQELKIVGEGYSSQMTTNSSRIEMQDREIIGIKSQIESIQKEIKEIVNQFKADVDTQLEELSEEISDSTHQFVKYSEFKSLRTAAIAILMAIGGQVISKALAGLL